MMMMTVVMIQYRLEIVDQIASAIGESNRGVVQRIALVNGHDVR